jgi:hypothetical protein
MMSWWPWFLSMEVKGSKPQLLTTAAFGKAHLCNLAIPLSAVVI